jgi:hypothetical protein
MTYVENKLHYEDWEVDNDDEDGVTIISIVNDFFEIGTSFGGYTYDYDLEPLEYWVEIPGGGCISNFPQGDYKDCVEWIKDNYLNSYKLEKN